MRWLPILSVLFLGMIGNLSGEDLASYPFFKAITGEWIGEGELVNADGETTAIHEEWKGEMKDDGTFVMEGDRQWGDEQQQFQWVFSFNASSELVECEYWHTGMENKTRLEVSLTEERAELMAPFGDPGSELRITNSLTEEGIEGLVSMKTAEGNEVLSGKVNHRKR